MLPIRVRGMGAVDSAAAHRLAFRMTLCSSAARLSRGRCHVQPGVSRLGCRGQPRYQPWLRRM